MEGAEAASRVDGWSGSTGGGSEHSSNASATAVAGAEASSSTRHALMDGAETKAAALMDGAATKAAAVNGSGGMRPALRVDGGSGGI
jgi:hypothetical protein